MKTKKKFQKDICISISLLIAFFVWTILICMIDVKPIGPNDSSVGFASVNKYIHDLIGVNMALYTIGDWLSIIPIIFAFGFTVLGLFEWIKRRSLFRVDTDLLALGVFYIAVALAYIIFEIYPINYRPVLINGYLEASYPSSTTLLITCFMPTALMQLNLRIKPRALKLCINIAIWSFIVFMVICRLIAGVHWITDIIGGLLLSAGLVKAYAATLKLTKNAL